MIISRMQYRKKKNHITNSQSQQMSFTYRSLRAIIATTACFIVRLREKVEIVLKNYIMMQETLKYSPL